MSDPRRDNEHERERRRRLIAALPGAQPLENFDQQPQQNEVPEHLSARARDLDRMYERVMRARVERDDAASLRAGAADDGDGAEVSNAGERAAYLILVFGLAGALAWLWRERMRMRAALEQAGVTRA